MRLPVLRRAKPSISGRYPNLGPEVLVQAGVPLLDDLGEALFERLREGDVVRVEADTVYLNGQPVASGTRQDAETIRKAMIDAREGLSVQLEAFAANTMEYLLQERDLRPSRPPPPARTSRCYWPTRRARR